MENGSSRTLEQILEEAQALSVEQRIELVHKLLGNSGLSITLGNNSLRADSITQINIMSREDASELLRASATRIGKENKPSF